MTELIKKTSETKVKKSGMSLDSIAFVLVFFGIFLLPIFFLPRGFNISLDIAKTSLISIIVVVAFFLWLIARLKDGRFIFPKSTILVSAGAIVLVFIISAIFSGSLGNSFVGLMSELGTASSVLIMVLLLFLSSIFFQDNARIFYLYGAFLVVATLSFIYLVVFQVIPALFGVNILPNEFIGSLPTNLIGKWSDVAVFFGLTGIISLATIELFPGQKLSRWIVYGGLGVSILGLIAINFALVWIVFGVFTLIIFVYAMSVVKDRKTFPATSFILVLFALFMILAQGPVGNIIFKGFQIPQEILRPSWADTLEIAGGTLRTDPILGSGPNRFTQEWLTYKPSRINQTQIWNSDFTSAVGTIPTFTITTGIVGTIAWLVFLALILHKGSIAMFKVVNDRVAHYFILSTFLGTVYLWTLNIFFIPNIVGFALAFVMTGVLIALLVNVGIIKNYNFSYLNDPRVGFASVLALILLILISVTGAYFLGQKTLGVVYAQKSFVRDNATVAQEDMRRALSFNEADSIYRRVVDVDLARVTEVVQSPNASKDALREQFEFNAKGAVNAAITATEIDSTNYTNFVALGKAYEALIPFGFTEGYANAEESYNKAIELNPKSPALRLIKARLELSRNDSDKAEEYIQEALNIKTDYVEAILLFSQIQVNKGNLKAAIDAVELSSILVPNDFGILFQLGFLRYKNEDYRGAISAFEGALRFNPFYGNAKYFLGLSYEEVGRSKDAIAQFEDIVNILDPSAEEPKTILR
ncbi:MAG TPA: tetratricopeptide repeat protein, partial [Candidatus Yonathbacteria bacterium]|nr:tetratricopeptide repeat protein [Candidatus Yonathbacteria bacterium]